MKILNTKIENGVIIITSYEDVEFENVVIGETVIFRYESKWKRFINKIKFWEK